jgi:hypothetical protein
MSLGYCAILLAWWLILHIFYFSSYFPEDLVIFIFNILIKQLFHSFLTCLASFIYSLGYD